jgi:hypothetical protein
VRGEIFLAKLARCAKFSRGILRMQGLHLGGHARTGNAGRWQRAEPTRLDWPRRSQAERSRDPDRQHEMTALANSKQLSANS